MDYIDSYCKLIIKPLENLHKEAIENYEKSWFFKKKYKTLIDDIDNQLMEKYIKLNKMINEEIEFQDSIKKLIESN